MPTENYCSRPSNPTLLIEHFKNNNNKVLSSKNQVIIVKKPCIRQTNKNKINK